MRSWTLLLVAAAVVLATPVVAETNQVDAAAPVAEAELAPDTPEASPTATESAQEAAAEDVAMVEDSATSEDAAILEDAPILEDQAMPVDAAETAASDTVDPGAADAPASAQADWDGSDPAFDTPAEPVEVFEPFADPDSGLGPFAIDAKGQKGRIHTVSAGDTLWDISATYLGSAWVWPSVWQDNREIANPHMIEPGDRIWITAGEMRIVTEQEADAMIAAEREVASMVVEPSPEAEPVVEPMTPPAELAEVESDLMADEVPASMDNLPVAVPLAAGAVEETGRSIRVAEREAMGFVTTEAVEAATSIIDSPSPRTYLVDGDMVYLGKGEGEVEVDDEFTIFRDAEGVVDTETGRLLGYHVEVLGWVVVREVNAETATAEVRISRSGMTRGDRVTPRIAQGLNVPMKITPDGIEGKIVFMPDDRTSVGDGDYVYLNRGSLHGFELGSEVEVFTRGELKTDRARRAQVMTPDHVAAHMVLVEIRPDSSVAFVVSSSRELEVGDRVRAATRKLASR